MKPLDPYDYIDPYELAEPNTWYGYGGTSVSLPEWIALPVTLLFVVFVVLVCISGMGWRDVIRKALTFVPLFVFGLAFLFGSQILIYTWIPRFTTWLKAIFS